jgi:hypothetical protein
MDRPIVDLTLPHDYEVSSHVDLPGSGGGVFYQPGASTTSGRDGLLLRFIPRSAKPWLGCFAFGHPSYQFTGIFAGPNPQFACVVSKGAAYWVNATNPFDCSKLNLTPVLGARVISEQDTILLWDFITLALLGSDGQLWRSPRLCWDELQITKIQDGVVYGTGHNPLGPHDGEFRFDLKSRTVLDSLYPRELGVL